MTLEDIKVMDRETITPAVAASVIGCDPCSIRIVAHTEPESLGFPVIVMGSRTKIPRRAFINFMESGWPWFLRNKQHAQSDGDRIIVCSRRGGLR